MINSACVLTACRNDLPSAVEADATLSCVDGANGLNTVLQMCDGLLYLETALGAGCTVPVFNAVCTWEREERMPESVTLWRPV